MSGECDKCGEHTLECVCGSGCPCHQSSMSTHLNLVSKPLSDGFGGQDPGPDLPPVRWINVRGRIEHEAVIRDAQWCKDLGLDQAYEIMVYLKRWGGWLNQ